VTIDGTSQPGFTATPLVEINGSSAGTASFGLDVAPRADGTIIRSLVIDAFAFGQQAILVEANAVTVAGNYLGTDPAGTTANGAGVGVEVAAGAGANTIGGLTAPDHNVISGNTIAEVQIDSGANGNVVEGNYIGTNAAGSGSLSSFTCAGVVVNSGSNVVGGTLSGAGNVISGNTLRGVDISGGATTGNVVEGNYVGTDVTGTSAVANQAGILITGGAPGNLIGTNADGVNDAAERNVISGNTQYGVDMNGATNDTVPGNYIGTNAAGTALLANGFSSVATFFSTGNVIGTDGLHGAFNADERNVISGSVILQNANVLAGNYIGLNAAGTAALSSNPQLGVQVSGTTGSRVGTNGDGAGDAAERNVISGINGPAMLVSQPGAIIAGNYIGTDPTGAFAIPNQTGIQLDSSVTGVRIGTNAADVDSAAEGNLISGNTSAGVEINTTSNGNVVAGNVVEGNYIGTNPAGNAALGNESGIQILSSAGSNTIGGTSAGAGNVISGNTLNGSQPSGVGAKTGDGLDLITAGSGNVVEGNFIGTDATGTTAYDSLGNFLGNYAFGVLVDANDETIGGTSAGARNIISGNDQTSPTVTGGGVLVEYGSGNVVEGNYVGTDATGSAALPNGTDGILLTGGASANTVGGAVSGVGNLISGNAHAGVHIVGSPTSGNVVAGNVVGLNAAGTGELHNGSGDGVLIEDAAGNTVGGTAAAARNVLSGNFFSGVEVSGANAAGTLIEGNYIGRNASGSASVANTAQGIEIDSGATGVTVGGTAAGAGNLISGNTTYGLLIAGSNATTVQGNLIGTDAAGTARVANGNGVFVNASTAKVGSAPAAARNVISGNTGFGIEFGGGATVGNVLQGNYVGVDVGGATALGNGGDGVFISSQANVVIGGAAAGAGNVISGNGGAGVEISGGLSTGNAVQGNSIGTDATGSAALGNGIRGIYVVGTSTSSPVTGTVIIGNLISSNGIATTTSGIRLDNDKGSVVRGNTIGTNAAGTVALGNGFAGVRLVSSQNDTIGGLAAGAGNLIDGNVAAGVYLDGATGSLVEGNFIGTDAAGATTLGNHGDGVAVLNGATGNAIRANSIFANGGLGIDLGNDGVTANDLSGHVGPNNFQNFPALAFAAVGASTRAVGALNAAANTTYTLDFYASPSPDASGYGEGEHYLGSGSIATDANGRGAFDLTVPGVITANDWVSATATDPAGNTSEFSRTILADPLPTVTLPAVGTTTVGLTVPFTPAITDPAPCKTYQFAWGVTLGGARSRCRPARSPTPPRSASCRRPAGCTPSRCTCPTAPRRPASPASPCTPPAPPGRASSSPPARASRRGRWWGCKRWSRTWG
jgi:hypothetical protein